jgi:hypothetical protein
MTSTTCRENKTRTEVLEEWCDNGGLEPFDDDRSRLLDIETGTADCTREYS